MQSAASRIWTRVAVSISYDGNHYTTGTSNIVRTLSCYVAESTGTAEYTDGISDEE